MPGLVEVGIAEHGVEGHRAAAAPAPDADALGVDIGPGGEGRPDRRGLVGRGQDADLAVDALAPGPAARRGRAAVVEAGHDVALLGQHQVPEVAVAAPAVLDGLPGGLAVDVDEQRIFLGRVEVGRQDAPAVDLDPVADRRA